MFKKASKYLPQIVAMLFLAGFVAYAWTEPSSAPPDGNVDSPVNVGSASQYKSGALGIGGVLRGYANAIFDGWVGIGTASPQGLLDVGGGKFVVATEGATNFTAGPNNPTTAVDGGGVHSPWSNPRGGPVAGSLVALSDDSFVHAFVAGSGDGHSTNLLKVTGFNFSLPTNAVIDGIEAKFERRGNGIMEGGVYIIKNSVVGMINNVDPFDLLWPMEDAYKTYGGPSDKWGLSWLPVEINSSDFGIAIMAQDSGVDPNEARIDHVRIKIYYHTGGTNIVRTDGRIRASQGIPVYSCPDIDACAGTEILQDLSISYHTCDGRVSLSASCASVRNTGGACPGSLTSFNCSLVGRIIDP